MRKKILQLIKKIVNENMEHIKSKSFNSKTFNYYLISKISSELSYNQNIYVKYKNANVEIRCMSSMIFKNKKHGLYFNLPQGIPYFTIRIYNKYKKNTSTYIPRLRLDNYVVLISFLKNENNNIEVILAYVLPNKKSTQEIRSLEKFITMETTRQTPMLKLSAKKIAMSDNKLEKENLLFWSLKDKTLDYYVSLPIKV